MGSCWFLNGKITGFPTEWLLDTGASVNLIAAKTYFALPDTVRPPLRPLDTKLFGANGSPLRVYGEVILTLEIGEGQYAVTVVVADVMEVQGILGVPFFNEHRCSLDMGQGLLTCESDCYPLFRYGPTQGV